MCSTKMDTKTDLSINSDAGMYATKMFNNILDIIQNSHLNFQLQLSPYSAVISIKKTLIKDRFGLPVMPTLYYQNEKVGKLETDLQHIQREYEELKVKYTNACQSISILESQCRDYDVLKKEIELKNVTVKEMIKTIEDLDENVRSRDVTISNLKSSFDATQQVSLRLDEQFIDLSSFKNTKADIVKATNYNSKNSQTTKNNALPGPVPEDLYSDTRSEKEAYTLDLNDEFCARRSCNISQHIPDHLMWKKIKPACCSCKSVQNVNGQIDAFSSFPEQCLPSSLVAHWIPMNTNPPLSIGITSSLKTHYVDLPYPGSQILSNDEVFRKEFRELWKEHQNKNCKLS